MSPEDQKLIEEFLLSEPDSPSDRFTKSELYKEAKKQHKLLCLIRKAWLATVADGVIGAGEKKRIYRLNFEAFKLEVKNGERVVPWKRVGEFIERTGIQNIINSQFYESHLYIWYAEEQK